MLKLLSVAKKERGFDRSLCTVNTCLLEAKISYFEMPSKSSAIFFESFSAARYVVFALVVAYGIPEGYDAAIVQKLPPALYQVHGGVTYAHLAYSRNNEVTRLEQGASLPATAVLQPWRKSANDSDFDTFLQILRF